MTISAFKKYFKTELSDLYTESESMFLSSLFIHQIVGFDQFQQRRFSEQELLIDDKEKLSLLVSELKTGRPYQQILGETEFYGMKFFVDEHVLIPRPETEELLEIAIREIKDSKFKVQGLKILDIGTGSGIIPLVLKKHFPEAKVSSIDFSENALKTAKRNAEHHQLDIRFIHADYLNFDLAENYDIIISNPPYIGIEEEIEIADSVKEFEPKMALFSPTSDALIFYRKIADDAKRYLDENGLLFLEINQKLGPETLELYQDLSDVQLLKDLSENDRFIYGKK
ncbi:release factor glutamine methyltransferase [Chryseobacterium bernardetii]|uniref:peptide chain release factor N(5)-glutamine methyltransferase n=2 Tax=Chryseobacterium TaxID=59732 RepID=A0A543EKC3_9FLAO|nr:MULTISPECIES: peptide chain release factor N(5)-glutamine methyltransferase [Chryseobacterium]MDR6372021.1 release factor glutamine methyltransferase [Chryseobacterium vietnamense]MDR6442596.1 release factor glutamine methyltransferase [Chryseobacterium bernardetii]TQM22023.1 release factor glutamine methyltransferase [Chryseobacterium aquifrigidense]